MDITNAVIYEVLAKQRPHQAGASNAGSRRRPFPWVGTGAPVLFPHGLPLGRLRRRAREDASRAVTGPEVTGPEVTGREGATGSARESLGMTATMLAIVVAALI